MFTFIYIQHIIFVNVVHDIVGSYSAACKCVARSSRDGAAAAGGWPGGCECNRQREANSSAQRCMARALPHSADLAGA